MKSTIIALCLTCLLVSCNSSKGIITKKSKSVEVYANDSKEIEFEIEHKTEEDSTIELVKTHDANYSKADLIIDYAKQFDGVKYKFGGTTKQGMDCSGLVSTAFHNENIELPRTSKGMAIQGEWVDIKEVQKGDLLFFATRRNSREVSHVGLVTESRPGYVEFIHATTRLGVTISSLAERYWYFAFIQARRVL
ncbi:cell wall-associated NlpC family hydrolase [Flavobacteriaceae bacterium MAR_2010_72]|nr:cell wall-associated NlpC family hydrolase [Flavobacteriaceae bacterium MAR_2010_72]TVZ57829.1 cell wall-associated NlpC family hydrolase [Flavobacteriaceae bacterium MAR_2010_105]